MAEMNTPIKLEELLVSDPPFEQKSPTVNISKEVGELFNLDNNSNNKTQGLDNFKDILSEGDKLANKEVKQEAQPVKTEQEQSAINILEDIEKSLSNARHQEEEEKANQLSEEEIERQYQEELNALLERVKTDGNCSMIPKEAFTDEIALSCIKINPTDLMNIPSSHRSKEVCDIAFNADSNQIVLIPGAYVTKDMLAKSISANPKIIKDILPDLQTQDLWLYALRANPELIEVVPKQFIDKRLLNIYYSYHKDTKWGDYVIEKYNGKRKNQQQQQNKQTESVTKSAASDISKEIASKLGIENSTIALQLKDVKPEDINTDEYMKEVYEQDSGTNNEKQVEQPTQQTVEEKIKPDDVPKTPFNLSQEDYARLKKEIVEEVLTEVKSWVVQNLCK